MIQWALVGSAILGTGILIKYFQNPKIVELSPPGDVIFNPAPSTGSATFLGDITGQPGMYWNVTSQSREIPSGYIKTVDEKVKVFGSTQTNPLIWK